MYHIIKEMSAILIRALKRLPAKYRCTAILLMTGPQGPYYHLIIEKVTPAPAPPPPPPQLRRTCSRVDEEIEAGKEVGFRPNTAGPPPPPPSSGRTCSGVMAEREAGKAVGFM